MNLSDIERAIAPRVTEIATKLAERRALRDVNHVDLRERRRLDVVQQDALAALDELAASRKLARRERARDESEAAKLAELYRRASRSGARARIRADINRSAEVRALRVEAVRKASLWIGLPVLIAFGLWSTAGVQKGVTHLLDLQPGSAMWLAAWLMEPALLTIVALIIVGRALLQSSGGDTDWRAWVIEAGALLSSLALNIAPSLSTGGDLKAAALVAESVGPLGAATTAFLIGLFAGYVAKARPWDDAPRLADLDLAVAQADAERVAELRQVGAPTDALLTHPADAPPTHPADAPATQDDDAPRQPRPPAVTQIDAGPSRRVREVVMRRPVSASPVDAEQRDAALRQAVDAVLTHQVAIRAAARDAALPEPTVRRAVARAKAEVTQPEQTNGHQFETPDTDRAAV
jgi:hypothetical protein